MTATRSTKIALVVLLGAAMQPALAQSTADEPTKATIRLMGDAADNLPEVVTKEIRLPENLAENSPAAVNSAPGREIANQNRLEGNQGIEQAEMAREKGAAMAEQAQDNRESRGRSEDHRPDPPEPPDTPAPGRP